MDDPFFEDTLCAVRGFDLGDDDELLRSLRRPDATLSADDYLLRGVLSVRAGKLDAALEDLNRATALGHRTAMSRVHYLRARLLSRQGRTAASGEALDAAERASHSDGLVPQAELAHARALSEWEAGRPDDALVHVAHGLGLDDTSADRWRDKASLYIELSRPAEALEPLTRALHLQTDDDAALVLQAICHAELGNVDATARAIERALHLRPQRRAALAGEPRLAKVRHHPSVARLLEPPSPPEVTWMDERAAWISALRYAMSRPDKHARHPIEWLDDTESRRLHATMASDHVRGPLGTMHSAATLAHARALLSERVVVGRSPGTQTRDGEQERCIIALDPGPHGQLWVALSEVYPAFLWIAAGRDAASLCAVLDVYYPRPALRRVDLSAEARGFIGYRGRVVVPSPYSGRLEPAGEVEIERHLTINPFVESAGWGSAFVDDPWPDEIPDQPGVLLKVDRHRRELAAQAPGAVWSTTHRLRHSRGHVSIERHHDEIFVAVVRYRPAPHRGAVRALNERFGTEYPEDLPLDAVGALLGFQFESATDLARTLQASDDAQEAAGLLMVISALRHSDLDAQALYRQWAKHPEATVRATVCAIAAAYNFESLLETMSLDESDPQLAAEIGAVLDEGIAPPGPPMAEPIRSPIPEQNAP